MDDPSTPFERAVKLFMDEPSKRRQPSFIQSLRNRNNVVTASDINTLLINIEKDSSQKGPKKVLRLVFNALRDYDAVITTLVSADPMPSALIWGGMKAAMECFIRYSMLFERIEGQLKRLARELDHLKEYERLFKESSIMQDILTQIYINVINFWAKVEDLCSSSVLALAAKATTSSTSRKLGDSIEAIADGTNNIIKMVPIVQERIRRGEHENATEERRKAGAVLSEILQLQKEEIENQRRRNIDSWLGGHMVLNDRNYRHQRNGEETLLPGAGDWLVQNPIFQSWMAETTDTNTIWLHGDPGSGKSVACARAVMEAKVKSAEQLATVAFQYYSFDDDDTEPSSILRSIASQLFNEFVGADDISDLLIDLTRSTNNLDALEIFIRAMVTKSKRTYIYLDGIDEEQHSPKRWEDAKKVLGFFTNLARQPDARLKLWCSSQDKFKIRDVLTDFKEIVINETTNGTDIEAFFEDALRTKLQSTFSISGDHPAAPILDDLKAQVHGNFLWAKLMIGSIRDAVSMRDLKERIKKGLPEDFEVYLFRHIKGLRRSPFVSTILSILAYAKRPLSAEELCEAIESFNARPTENIGGEGRIFEDRILYYCAPLIRIDETVSDKTPRKLCTLYHASIKEFLVRNPLILNDPNSPSSERDAITPSVLAESCLNYLRQPRYSDMLTKAESDIFTTSSGESVLDHHFLVYCATNWAYHMDMVGFSPEMGSKVEEFIRSQNFVTCIQIQSLFVGGHFYVSMIPGSNVICMQALPKWFGTNHLGGGQLCRQYYSAMKEWGYFLHYYSNVSGPFPGQISRCLWGTLETPNFLHVPSEFKGWTLKVHDTGSACARVQLYEKLIMPSMEILVMYWNKPLAKASEMDVVCEQWMLHKDHRPRYKAKQHLAVPFSQVELYCSQISQKLAPNVTFITLSDDGVLLRVGTNLYTRNKEGIFQLENMALGYDSSHYQVAHQRNIAACASHHRILGLLRHNSSTDDGSFLYMTADDISSSETTSLSKAEDEESETESISDAETSSSRPSRPISSQSITQEAAEDPQADWDSLASHSVCEYWSDGVSDVLSDELSERIPDSDVDPEEESFSSDGNESNEALDSGSIIPGEPSDADTSLGIFSNESASHKGESADGMSIMTRSSMKSQESFDPRSDFFEGRYDGYWVDRRRAVERYLNLKGGNTSKERISNVNIFRLVPDTGDYQQIFHFSQRSRGSLIDSPPIIHPYEDLVVWPNGIGELVFGDLNNKSYFASRCTSGSKGECLISVQGTFSPCGQYLHTASIYGSLCPRLSCDKIDEQNHHNIHYDLHVKTYRLSKTKPLRAPPHLIYRCVLEFLHGLKVGGRGPVRPSLRFTLTWLKEYVYVTMNEPLLRVARLPLFKQVEKREPLWKTTSGICENEGSVFLPASSVDRDVYFFPFPILPGKRQKSNHNKQETVAMLFLSSSTKDNPTAWRGCKHTLGNSRPPQIIFLNASQLGNWEPAGKEAFYRETKSKLDNADYLTSNEMLEKLETLCPDCEGIYQADRDAFLAR